MTDQELADQVVALGIGTRLGNHYSLENPFSDYSGLRAKYFIRSWRVAGALMEKARDVGFCPLTSENYFDPENDNMPRAIIEACAEASS